MLLLYLFIYPAAAHGISVIWLQVKYLFIYLPTTTYVLVALSGVIFIYLYFHFERADGFSWFLLSLLISELVSGGLVFVSQCNLKLFLNDAKREVC